MYFDQKWSSDICATNYEVGGTVTESYSDAESIVMDPNITSNAGASACSAAPEPSSALIASLSSRIVGNATVGWQSISPLAILGGRHSLTSRSVNYLSGEFTVSDLIQLFPNGTSGETGLNWMPCV